MINITVFKVERKEIRTTTTTTTTTTTDDEKHPIIFCLTIYPFKNVLWHFSRIVLLTVGAISLNNVFVVPGMSFIKNVEAEEYE